MNFRALAIAILVFVRHTPTCYAVEDVLPDEVTHALAENARQINGLELVWHQSRRLLQDAASVFTQLRTAEPEHAFTLKRECTVRIDGAKLFERFRNQETGTSFGQNRDDRWFNGEKYFSGSMYPSDGSNPGLLSIKFPAQFTEMEAKRARKTRLFEFTYLIEVGFQPPVWSWSLGKETTSYVLELIDQGKLISARKIEDRSLFEVLVEYPDPWAIDKDMDVANDPALQTLRKEFHEFQLRISREMQQLSGKTRRCRFLLDSTRNFAVKEATVFNHDGRLLFHTTCDDYFDVGSGLWLPRLCNVVSHTYYTRPSYAAERPLYETVLELQRAERRAFGADDFDVSFDVPGVLVFDYTLPDATLERSINYVIPASRDQLERAIRDATARHAAQSRPYHWLLIINGIILAILAICLIWTKWRNT